jgi:hypothetical protein
MGLKYQKRISLGSRCSRKAVGLPISVGPALPETQVDRPAFRHRTPRSPVARYTKRRCQGSFGSFLGSGPARADDGGARYDAARGAMAEDQSMVATFVGKRLSPPYSGLCALPSNQPMPNAIIVAV